MKKAFEILAFTLLELVIYILLISGFYYLFSSLILSSMETSIHFSITYLLDCIIRFAPACSIFSIMLLIFSFISRDCSFKEMIIPYAIISAIVWILIVPFALSKDGGMIPGFTTWIARIQDDPSAVEMFTLPGWTSFLLARFELLHDQLVYFFQGYDKVMGLLQYASFFLSLAALGCFARFSTWRLWNAFFVIFAFAGSVVINSYMFDFSFMSTLGLSEYWAKWLPFYVNGGIFILYTLFGVVSMIGSARRGRR